ncbi:DUF1611 domain-containing protein [Mesobacillus harenae]|uniref:DUF1611 domain-containing protein n=1 Tax=Mesobacillus harenae TaxID=2213203 RepID=UPI0015806724|nr:DUF1611 domain-containing protein [Mesobacillus harenae]
MQKTAIIYCEGNFGKMDGKTANGLIRNSKNYEIVGVIDSTKAHLDSGEFLEGKKNNVPIYTSLEDVIENVTPLPDQFIYGIAPAEAFLKTYERNIILKAMETGMDIINPLHEFFTEDKEFTECADKFGVSIHDVRKPLPNKDLHLFSGRILNISTPTIAVLGTDSAVGKRTTSVILEAALAAKGFSVSFVATGQTGIIQGAKYGVAIDAIPLQFMIGEIENEIMKAYENDRPDIIIVEGQGALSHPGYVSSCGILRGSRPGAVIVQHPPMRQQLGDFPFMKMPTIESEIELIENFSDTKVIAVTINHENMTDAEVDKVIDVYEEQLEIPATDVLLHGCDKLVMSILDTFPELKNKYNRAEKVLIN